MKTISAIDEKSDLLKIITFPDPLLTRKSERVENITQEIVDLSGKMIKAMIAAPGQGLAAVQVGALKRIIVMDDKSGGEDDEIEPVTMINPEIIDSEGVEINEEGCLSIPTIYADLPRPSSVRVSFTSLDGRHEQIELKGASARCLAHEVDHLDGSLFWDRLSKGRRLWLKMKFFKRFGLK
ncbi:MAG TPA: peptide deformylase [Nitrospirae bacterium]|nr:peptide deformylase [Nitrospirota bacterium]